MSYFIAQIESSVLTKLSSQHGDDSSLASRYFAALSSYLTDWKVEINKAIEITRRFSNTDLQTLILDTNYVQPTILLKTAAQIKRSPKKKKENSNKSVQVTIDLLKEGRALPEIAKERKLSLSTVEKHVLDAAEEGESLTGILLDNNSFENIRDAIQQTGTDIDALFEQMEGRYTFFELRLAVVILKSQDILR